MSTARNRRHPATPRLQLAAAARVLIAAVTERKRAKVRAASSAELEEHNTAVRYAMDALQKAAQLR